MERRGINTSPVYGRGRGPLRSNGRVRAAIQPAEEAPALTFPSRLSAAIGPFLSRAAGEVESQIAQRLQHQRMEVVQAMLAIEAAILVDHEAALVVAAGMQA